MGQVPSLKPKLGAQRGKKLHGFAELFLTTKPSYAGETFKEFLEARGLWEHDLRHGLRSFEMNSEMVELRERAFDPSSNVTILIEQEFSLSGVFIGFMDLVVLDRSSGELKVTIHDHKFMSDKRSVMSENEALEDYQTLIYAKTLLTHFPIESVTWSFDYYGTKYRWSEKVNFLLTRSEVEAKWLGVLSDSSRVLDNYTIPKGSQTTANYLSCSNYGGCEYRTTCFGGESK